MLRTVANYSPVPKPRRGNRRVSGGGTVGGAEPRLAGLDPSSGAPATAVPGDRSAAPKTAESGGGFGSSSRKKRTTHGASKPLTPEEKERLEWMRQQRPPHWGNNIV